MALRSMTPVSTKEFTWVKEEKVLAIEMSDLDARGIRLEQVWDDACDLGILLRSHRTGNEVPFCISLIEKRDGDLLYWELEPAALYGEGPRPIPDCKVRIFND